jgi:general secretion pathway protein J
MREFAGTHGDADFWRPAPLLGVGAWSEGEEEPRRRRRGFTLLEVMVALVLTSLIALLAYGAARITGDTRTQLNQHLRSVHAARGARELLPDLLHNVRAPQRRGDTTMILRGDTLWLIAAGVVPFDPDYDWLVELHPGPGGLEVDGLARGLSPPARVRFRLPEVTRWEVALLPAKGSEWNRDWSPAAGSPRAVRVTLWNDTQPVGLPVVVRLPGARSADQADEEDETQNDR